MTAIKGRFVRLADIGAIPTPKHDIYSADLMEKARVHHVARALTYDNKTGEMRDCTGNLSRLSRPSDHEPLHDVESVMRWHFRNYLANSASRISRGLAP